MVLLGRWDGGDGLTEDREKRLEVEAGEEVESERLRLGDIAKMLNPRDAQLECWREFMCVKMATALGRGKREQDRT